MASTGDIRAGRAYVELLLKDADFNKKLDSAGKALQSWGKQIAMVGSALAAVGAAITAPFAEMTREFSQAGAELFNMSKRTNESVEALHFLQYAAEETGTSLDVIQRAIFAVQKKGKDFDTVALQIAGIQDPAKQSQRAIEEFGKKAGPFLLPLLRDLPALRAEFDRLGLAKGMSADDVKNAKDLDSAFHGLTAVIKSVRNVIGAALAPVIKDMTEWVTDLIIRFRDWIAAHRDLIVSVFNFGRVLVAVGTAIAGVGASLYAVGTILSGFSGLFALAGTVITALLSPIGLLVVGLGALAYWFATSTTKGRAAVGELKGLFISLKDTAVEAFNGIVDALAAGDFILAAKILWAGLKVEWSQGVLFLREKWATVVTFAKQEWADFKHFFTTTTIEIKYAAIQAWTEMSAQISTIFTNVKIDTLESLENIKAALKSLVSNDLGKAQIEIGRSLKIAELERGRKGLNRDTEARRAFDEAGNAWEKNRELGRNPKQTVSRTTANDPAIAQANAELARRKAELVVLDKQAAIERNARGRRGAGPRTPFVPDTGDIKTNVSGTFSAAAATRGSGAAASPEVKELREQRGIHLAHLKEIQELRRMLRNSGLQS